jgi:hypothetical protein
MVSLPIRASELLYPVSPTHATAIARLGADHSAQLKTALAVWPAYGPDTKHPARPPMDLGNMREQGVTHRCLLPQRCVTTPSPDRRVELGTVQGDFPHTARLAHLDDRHQSRR